MPIDLRGRPRMKDGKARLKAIEKGGPGAKVPVTIRALMARCNRDRPNSVEKVYRRDLDLFLVDGVALPFNEFEQTARALGMLRDWEYLATE
jgi:hypothetical protein